MARLSGIVAALLLALPGAAWAADPVCTPVTASGLVARLCTPAEAKGRRPAIVVLGGSEGGLGEGAGKDAALIAAHGYVTLQLAYFGAPGLPKDLGLIPLEYFRTAIAWLQAQPGVDPARIGLEGTSVGGEAALLVAAHSPEIRVVVAAVPSSVVWPGISHTSTSPPSSFSLAGRPLPDLPYGWAGPSTTIFQLYELGLKARADHPDAVIPVERINGPVMLICGEADSLWPSCPMTEQVAARLAAKGFRPKVERLAYADAGHAVFGPPLAADSPSLPRLGDLGGTPAGNQAARLDDWARAMAFMDAVLKP